MRLTFVQLVEKARCFLRDFEVDAPSELKAEMDVSPECMQVKLTLWSELFTCNLKMEDVWDLPPMHTFEGILAQYNFTACLGRRSQIESIALVIAIDDILTQKPLIKK